MPAQQTLPDNQISSKIFSIVFTSYSSLIEHTGDTGVPRALLQITTNHILKS